MSATNANQAFCEDCQTEGSERQKQKPCKITREELRSGDVIYSSDNGETCKNCGHSIFAHPNRADRTTILAAQAKAQAESQTQALAHDAAAPANDAEPVYLGIVKAFTHIQKMQDQKQKEKKTASSLSSTDIQEIRKQLNVKNRKYARFLEELHRIKTDSEDDEVTLDENAVKDSLRELWTARDCPEWFSKDLWDRKTETVNLGEHLASLIRRKVKDELKYQEIVHFVLRCSLRGIHGDDVENLRCHPTFASSGGGVKTMQTVTQSICYENCSSSNPDGIVLKSDMESFGPCVEIKPYFLNGAGTIYDRSTLIDKWYWENLCQFEGCRPSNQKYGFGVLTSWGHWVLSFVKRTKNQLGQKCVTGFYCHLGLPPVECTDLQHLAALSNLDSDFGKVYFESLVNVAVAVGHLFAQGLGCQSIPAEPEILETIVEAVEHLGVAPQGPDGGETENPDDTSKTEETPGKDGAKGSYMDLAGDKAHRARVDLQLQFLDSPCDPQWDSMKKFVATQSHLTNGVVM